MLRHGLPSLTHDEGSATDVVCGHIISFYLHVSLWTDRDVEQLDAPVRNLRLNPDHSRVGVVLPRHFVIVK